MQERPVYRRPSFLGLIAMFLIAVSAMGIRYWVVTSDRQTTDNAFIEVPGDAIMRNLVLRNQAVVGTVNAGRVDFESAARDLLAIRQQWPGTLGALITGRHPMSAFCELAVGGRGIKNVIALGESP